MPFFDWECTACGNEAEHYARMDVEERQCEDCGGLMKRLITTRYTVGGKELDYVEENLGHEPVRIRNVKQLEREMRKRDLYMRSNPKRRWW